MTFNELRQLFYYYNPLGEIWIAESDDVCLKATSTSPIETYKGTHDEVARQLNLAQYPSLITDELGWLYADCTSL